MNLKMFFSNPLKWTILFVMFGNALCAQTFWTCPMITFSKANYADWTLPENQDCITPNVCITRADNQGIFNIVTETGYDGINRTSPANTEWANGSIADGIQNLTFTTWFNSIVNSPTEDVGVNKVVHLIAEDIYIDIVFTSWTAGGGGSGTGFGGGFSYMRSTPPSCPTDFNGDGITNNSDFLALLGQFGQACNADCPTDINNDGVTNNSDFLVLLGQFGQACD